MAKKVPQINASSMADISFLLLIFFLVTTSMDVNQGLARRLPAPIPPDQKVEDKDINKRNLLVVKINSANQLMVQGQLMDVKQLKDKAKEFILNENNADYYPKVVLPLVPLSTPRITLSLFRTMWIHSIRHISLCRTNS